MSDLARVTWCRTINAYADPDRCTLDTKRLDHVHEDVLVDYTDGGRVLYPLHPVGTVYLHDNGDLVRLVGYDRRDGDDDVFPRYEILSPARTAPRAAIAEGATRIVYPNPDRLAVGSIFICPNGETWRLTGYSPGWLRDEDHDTPRWTVQTPKGTTYNGETLPDDARLAWAP